MSQPITQLTGDMGHLAGRSGGGGNGGSRPLRTPPRKPQPQPGGGVESPSPRRPPTPTSVSNHARAVQDSCVLSLYLRSSPP